MKKKLKLISKAALLLVIVGFFQPVACNQNGFELAKEFVSYDNEWRFIGIGLYILFALISISLIYTFFMLIGNNDLCSTNTIDFALLIGSVAVGLATLFSAKNFFNMEQAEKGFYLIVIGLLLSLVFLIASTLETE